MDPTKRFSNRVNHYVKYRPGYPAAIVDLLKQDYGLSSTDEVADIGAGVGHSAKLLAPHVGYIYGIEPNQEMYQELVRQMQEFSNFSARLQSAENTSLEARSVNYIVCAQSYHWFSERMARTEFERILEDEGYIVLMWNSRRSDYEFGSAYEQFLRDFGVDYEQIRHKNVSDEEFDYLMSNWKRYTFDNVQQLDLQGLIGRFTSSSYAPDPGTTAHDQAKQALSQLFEQYQRQGRVDFRYETEVIVGKL